MHSFLIQVKENHKKGSKLTVADNKGWTPLHHAARLGKKEVVKYLAENSKWFVNSVLKMMLIYCMLSVDSL